MQSQVMGQTWKGRDGNGEKTCGGYVHKTELTELSLAPTPAAAVLGKSRNSSSSSSESENTPSRKRKLFSDPFQLLENGGAVPVQASVDLHARSPLPLDWEQCLDLESGRMYYLNRKTLRKSWSWPKNQKLDLELNMSTVPSCPDHQWNSSRISSPEESDHNKNHASRNSSNMVALACSNCHLLVILSKSSPSCPNCKYFHSFSALRSPPQKRVSSTRSLSTLRLLN
ncbi:BOMB/KIRA PROTEINS [Salix viminalis]|uniref:BOMB/KIRA PROTEINS n=1 Tax=Salix viminalis TaxID=40686 RepID=A0A9Q0SFA8_SALVM|nr:BOMB/KIRA PROTEINS [Salix viminalis]